VAEQAGRIDISFNLISYGDVQEPLTEISVEDFTRPITTAMRTQFLTTRAAARHMVEHGSGVISAFGGSGPHHDRLHREHLLRRGHGLLVRVGDGSTCEDVGSSDRADHRWLLVVGLI
jgi:NAD(P)-dependent dehydrogenase (short-subunit alcohol dehydrogenase family)